MIKVDVIVCVTTSITLLNSILRKAGHSVRSEYERQSHSSNPILLDGGHIAARKILFIPWQQSVQRSTLTQDEKVHHLIPLNVNRILPFISVAVRFCETMY